MTPRPWPGLFIVFEGIDGAGKSTQVRRLRDALRTAGLTVVCSKEPTDGPWGRRIREAAQTRRLPLDEELHAFIEDRKEHIATLIRPALEAGQVVILDRYFYSSVAYQGSRGANVEAVEAMMRAFAPIPDVVFMLDVDPHVGLDRIANQRGEAPTDFERLDTLTTVRSVFNTLAATRPEIRLLDASCSPDAVHTTIRNLLLHLLRTRLATPDAPLPLAGAGSSTDLYLALHAPTREASPYPALLTPPRLSDDSR